MGVNMGYRPVRAHTTTRKFAWRPIRTGSGKWVFWKHYYRQSELSDGSGTEYRSYRYINITENEYLIYQIQNSERPRTPPVDFFFKSRRGPRPGY